MAYELKTGGVLLHPIFGGGKEKDKYVYCSEILQTLFHGISLLGSLVCVSRPTQAKEVLIMVCNNTEPIDIGSILITPFITIACDDCKCI